MPKANRATRRHPVRPESYEMTLPPASVALLQAQNERIKAEQNELAKLAATMLSVLVTDGSIATNVNIDTGIVSLTRGPALAEVGIEDGNPPD